MGFTISSSEKNGIALVNVEGEIDIYSLYDYVEWKSGQQPRFIKCESPFSKAYKYIIASTFFLVATALAPSMRELYPFYFWVHKLTAVIFFVFLSLSMGPFLKFVSRENPRLRKVIIVWTIIILGGVIILGLLYGNTGLFELWGFGSMLIFLLYLSLTLFEEQIVKQSVKLLKGEQDLNLGIESIFVNWEKLLKKKKKKS